MSDHTGIEWTDATWNPVVGCTKVSQGCKLCWAKTLHDMRHAAVLAGKQLPPQYAEPFERVQLMPDRLTKPLSWRKPRKIFVNSVSDLFHEDVPFTYIAGVFAVMGLADRHTFQVLTKRPERMREFFRWVEAEARRLADADGPDHDPWDGMNVVMHHALDDALSSNARFDRAYEAVAEDFPAPWPLQNVWLGVSAENQEAADERIPLLVDTPAAVRFLSLEPLLGPVDLLKTPAGDVLEECPECGSREGTAGCRFCDGMGSIGWVIVGGESGSSKQNPRPMHPDWARSLRDQCVDFGVPFLFKQWGDWLPIYDRDVEDPDWVDAHQIATDTPRGEWLNLAGGSGFHGDRVVRVNRVGKKRAGRELDGRTWDEYPAPVEATR